MKKLKDSYGESTKEELYGEIQDRRENGGEEAFQGIYASTSKDEMIAALESHDSESGKAQAQGAGKSSEKAGVGTPSKAENIGIPDEVKIKREVSTEEGTVTTASASVRGNQALQVIDVMHSRPVNVYILENVKPFLPEMTEGETADTKLVFIQGEVSSELLPYSNARSKFALKPDGTVIYNQRGFDDVPSTTEFDMVDIVKLVEHNHGAGKQQREKAQKEQVKLSQEAEKRNKEKAQADEKKEAKAKA